MSLENKIFAITGERFGVTLIELLLVGGGLKKVLSGIKEQPSKELIQVMELLNFKDSINLKEDALFLKKMRKYRDKYGVTPEYHTICGQFYDYPECCIKAFSEKQTNRSIFNKRLFVKPLPYILDRLDLAYTFHGVCRLNCKETKKIASGYRDYIQSNFPKIGFIFESDFIRKRKLYLKRKGIILSPLFYRSHKSYQQSQKPQN